MTKKTIETSIDPIIRIDAIGKELNVKGWDRQEVILKTSSDRQAILEQTDDYIHVSSEDDCVLYVPHGASIIVKNISRDARFKSIEGSLNIQTVGRDLILRDVGPVEIKNIGMDLSAKRVRGDLKVGAIGASALVRDVDGQFEANSIASSLHLQDVGGGVSASVGSSASVNLAPVPWQAYSLKAGNTIHCTLTGDVNADIEMTSGAHRIYLKLPNQKETIREGNYKLKIGEGGSPISLIAGNKIELNGIDTDWDIVDEFDVDFGQEFGSMAEEIADQVTNQIETQMSILEDQLNIQLGSLADSMDLTGLPEERAEEVRIRLEQARQRAAERAEAAAERAQERLERKLAAAQRKAERKARAAAARKARKEDEKHSSRTGFTPFSVSSRAEGDPVSDEERLMILNMLQENKISLEEAEELLSALEGK